MFRNLFKSKKITTLTYRSFFVIKELVFSALSYMSVEAKRASLLERTRITFGNLKRGHTIEEAGNIARIVENPSSITPQDLKAYVRERLALAELLAAPTTNIQESIPIITPGDPYAVFKEVKRLVNLTPEQLLDEVLKTAQRKMVEWKLNPKLAA